MAITGPERMVTHPSYRGSLLYRPLSIHHPRKGLSRRLGQSQRRSEPDIRHPKYSWGTSPNGDFASADMTRYLFQQDSLRFFRV